MREEISQVAEELADETYRLVVSKLKSIDLLDKRLKHIEGRLVRHVGDFKTDIVEVERMVTETKENVLREQDESVTMLVGEVQELRDQLNALKVELNKLKNRDTNQNREEGSFE